MLMNQGQVRHPVRPDTVERAPLIDRLPRDGGLLGTPLSGAIYGVDMEYVYIGEVFTNMRGGRTTKDATAYMGAMNIALHADLLQEGVFHRRSHFHELAKPAWSWNNGGSVQFSNSK